jgi:hypothetical protein
VLRNEGLWIVTLADGVVGKAVLIGQSEELRQAGSVPIKTKVLYEDQEWVDMCVIEFR